MMKKKLIIFFTIAILIFISLPIFNYYVDRYNIFNSLKGNYSRYYLNTKNNYTYAYNDRFIPMHYLINQKHNYDSFIFGSSKLNSLDISLLGDKWYKLNYNSGTIQEHFYNLKVIKKKIPIENIILTISERTFINIKKGLNENINNILYPDTLKEWIVFYKKYLFKSITNEDINMFFKNDYKIEHNRRNYIRTKGNKRPYIKNDKKHIEKMNNMNSNTFNLGDEEIKQTIDIIKEFDTYCSQNNIKLTIIILPIFYKNLNETSENKLLGFKHELVKIREFYDFSMPHEYNSNPVFWKEMIHYLPILNEEILNTIRFKKNICNSFGVLIKDEGDLIKGEKYQKSFNCQKKIEDYQFNKEDDNANTI